MDPRFSPALCGLAVCLIAGSAPAGAAAVYGSLTAFQAAAGTGTTIDFNNIAGIWYAQSTTIGGVTFSNPTGAIYGETDNEFAAYGQYHSPYLEWQNGTSTLTVSFPNPVSAVGFDIMELRGSPDTFTTTIDGTVYTSTTGASPTFLGIVTDQAVSSFTISDLGDPSFRFATMDNLTYITASQPVPEPGTLALLGAGTTVLGWLRRRRPGGAAC